MDLTAIAGSTGGMMASSLKQTRMVTAAHEFEAQMMKELIEPLSNSATMMGGDDDSETGSTVALSDYAGQVLGQALSQQGGFGIANKIIGSLSRNGNRVSNH